MVQDFGVQLASYNMQGKLVSDRFIDISRVRDFVINEVSQFTCRQIYSFFICLSCRILVPRFFQGIHVPGFHRGKRTKTRRAFQGKCSFKVFVLLYFDLD